MKVRQGFVSNSSSSSFVIKTCCLTAAQKVLIENWYTIAKQLPGYHRYGPVDEYWDVYNDGDVYTCNTIMDNFDLRKFFEDLGIKCSDGGLWNES